MPVIEVQHLRKVYRNNVAVDDVSFNVNRGEIFGYIGPNGSGKTTTIKVLTTLTPPTSGQIHVLGYRIGSENESIRKRIGVVSQSESYESNLTLEDALDTYGLLWDVPKNLRAERTEELLKTFGLEDYRQRRVPELSLGLRRRLQVAREFMHEMELLFLDEPTIGLDPLSRIAFLDLIHSRAKAGMTIFFTTHFLAEAEYLCDRMVMLSSGRVVWEGTPKDFKEKFGGLRTIEIGIRSGDAKRFVQTLETIKEIEMIAQSNEQQLKILTREPAAIFSTIIRVADQLGITLDSISLEEPTLEQAFINFMKGRTGRQ
jgi:ABC-2 type transport system ATP-binding protein